MKKVVFWILTVPALCEPAGDIFYERIRRELDRESLKKSIFHDSLAKLHNYWEDFQLQLIGLPGRLYNDVVFEHPYQYEDASVRCPSDDSLAEMEEVSLRMRTVKVQKALQLFLGRQVPFKDVPRIAFCCSGGGFRSMVATLGFLQGMQDIGLLDGATYIATLSGSTWAVAPWIASRQSLEDYTDSLVTKIEGGLKSARKPKDLLKVLHKIVEKLIYGQYVSMMDVYGPLLGNTLLTDLGDDRFEAHLSLTHHHVHVGDYPFPIYTAIYLDKRPYEWFEVTPFELGSSHLKTYVPLWSYGRRFKAGTSIDRAKEQALYYFMAIFGSAFAIDAKDFIRMTGVNLLELETGLPELLNTPVKKLLHVLVHDLLNQVRLFPSDLFNYMYKLPECPLHSEHVLTLADAGIDFNLPLPPLLREQRHVDIIIVYDASADGKKSSELSRAQEYALRNGLKFPPIDYLGFKDKPVTVFKDEHDPTCPVIVYFPLIKNPDYSATFDPRECMRSGYCNTFNFKYGKQEIQELGGLARFVVNQQVETLRTVIQDVFNRKQATSSL